MWNGFTDEIRKMQIDDRVQELRENPLLYLLLVIFYGLSLPPLVLIVVFKGTSYFLIILFGYSKFADMFVPAYISFMVATVFYGFPGTLALYWAGLLWKFGVLVKITFGMLRRKLRGKNETYSFLTPEERKTGRVFFVAEKGDDA